MESNVVSGFSVERFAVEVVQSWKGQALDTELVTLDRPRCIAVGEVGRFLLPLGASFDVLVIADGRATVHVPAGATALVTEGESSREIAVDSIDRAFVVGAGTTLELTIADMTFFVRPVAKEKEKFASPLFDATGARWMAAALAFHVAILATFFFMPPDASALSSDLTGEQMRYIQVHLDAEQTLPPPPAPVTGGDANSGTSSAPASADGGPVSPTPAVSGGPGRPHRATQTVQGPMTAEQVRNLDVFGQLAHQFASIDGDTSPFDSGNPALTSGPGGPGLALIPGGLDGEGPGGLHMTQGHGTCTHEPCGTGTIDQGGLDTHGGPGIGEGPSLTARPPHETTPTIHMCSSSDPTCGRAVGGLTRDQIRSVIARHRPEVRFCYEQALIGRPALEGRVTVGFQIAQDGHVQNSTASGLAGVDSCVAQAAQRWQFPQSASPTIVSYPFILESAE
jgi:hypothetical protein